jgi:hypothetical protein
VPAPPGRMRTLQDLEVRHDLYLCRRRATTALLSPEVAENHHHNQLLLSLFR